MLGEYKPDNMVELDDGKFIEYGVPCTCPDSNCEGLLLHQELGPMGNTRGRL
jgi:hypothetical protein